MLGDISLAANIYIVTGVYTDQTEHTARRFSA